jgi:hypothetical protein
MADPRGADIEERADQHRKQEQLDAANAHADRMGDWFRDKPWSGNAADASQRADERVQGARDRLDPSQQPPKKYPTPTPDEAEELHRQWRARQGKGGPVRVFHGTSSEFKDFDPEKAGSNLDAGFFGKGSYFTTNPELAKSYARKGKGLEPDAPRSLHHVDLDLTNPYDFGGRTKFSGTRGELYGVHGKPGHGIPDEDGLRDAVYKRAGLKPVGPDDEPRMGDEPKLAAALRDELIARGHDGAAATHPDGSKEYVAFHGHAAKIRHTEAVPLSDKPDGDRAAAADAPPATRPNGTPHAPKVEDVHTVPTKSLVRRPELMQYKVSGIGEGGVTDELKGVKKYNQELGGTLLAWRHPDTGEDIVVNGHHRHEVAERTGEPTVNARYIQAPDAKAARARGALNNIAEGRGTATDAAKYLRDTGSTADDFREAGVSLSGRVAADALALKDLGDKPFQRLTEGKLDEPTAVAVAKHLKDPALQDVLFKKLDARGEEGKDWSTRQIERAAQKMARAGTVTKKGEDLFGSFEEQHPTFEQEVELEEHVARQLGQKVNDFAAVSNAGRAERVKDAGNQLAIEENQKRKKAAEDEAGTFGVQQDRVGPVSAAIKGAAAELATAKTRKERDAIKARTVEAVRDAIARFNADPFAVGAHAGGAEGGGAGRAADHGVAGGGPDPGQSLIDGPVAGPASPPPDELPAVDEVADTIGSLKALMDKSVAAGGNAAVAVRNRLDSYSNRHVSDVKAKLGLPQTASAHQVAAALKAMPAGEPASAPSAAPSPVAAEPAALPAAEPAEDPRPSSFLQPGGQRDIFGNVQRAARPSPKAEPQSLIPREVEKRADVEAAEHEFNRWAKASNPEGPDEPADAAEPNAPPDFTNQFHAAHAADDHLMLHDLIGSALRGDHGPGVKKQVGDAVTANAGAGAGLPDKYRRVAEAIGGGPKPAVPGTPDADPVSEPTSPVAAAEEKADAQDASPRERAAAASKATDPDYEFARASTVGNFGEDLKGSARHKANAWKGLADAEANGSAEELVTRDNLLKAEPHRLMATVTPHNALTHLAAHLALSAFPPAPYDPKALAGYARGEGKKTPAELRAEYYRAYQEIKDEAERAAVDEADPRKVFDRISQRAKSLIGEFRGAAPGADHFSQFMAPDRYNPVSNALVDLQKKAAGSGYKPTHLAARLADFAKRVKDKYGMPTPDTLDAIAGHVQDVIEGDSFNKTFGTAGAAGPARFDPSEAYVAHAERRGGRMIDAATVDAAKKHMLDNVKLRGVQWGNYVTDDERQHHLKKTAEAFADLADATGLPDSAISLGGKLGLAIGARGRAGARAHYEPNTQVINLTRTSGVGSLAHEWGHGLDHYLEGFADGDQGGTFHSGRSVSAHRDADPETLKAMRAVRQALQTSGYRDRLRAEVKARIKAGRLGKNAEDYWLSPHEMFARTFERHVQDKLHGEGRENTYLVGLRKDGHPLWPSAEEAAAVAPAMERLFEAVKQGPLGGG